MSNTREEYERQYAIKAERLRALLQLQKSQLSGSSSEAYDEVRSLDIELGQLRASIKAIETVEVLQNQSGLPVDRRSEHQLSYMVATVTEVANVKETLKSEIADIKKVVDRLAEDGKAFQVIMSDSIRSAHYAIFEKMRVLERIVIAVIVIVAVWVVFSLFLNRGLL